MQRAIFEKCRFACPTRTSYKMEHMFSNVISLSIGDRCCISLLLIIVLNKYVWGTQKFFCVPRCNHRHERRVCLHAQECTECHRPWYIGGNISRWISRFAKIALRWCKRWRTVTRIFRHIITDDDRRQIPHVVRRTTYYTEFPRGIATSSYPKNIKRYHLGICLMIEHISISL